MFSDLFCEFFFEFFPEVYYWWVVSFKKNDFCDIFSGSVFHIFGGCPFFKEKNIFFPDL